MTGTGEHDEVRADVRRWLADNWRSDVPRTEWLARVVDSGLAAPTWAATWYGRGYDRAAAAIVADEFRAVGAPGTQQDEGNLWASTMARFGSEDLKREFLRGLLTEELQCCLLYSEPGAGSDLAGLRTRADRDGDTYVVNGQKVWTSGAHKADYAMLLARTNWDVPKHQGITFCWLPMNQQGVEVRPIRQITGESHFNEVFLTDAEVPKSNVLGAVDGGWQVLQTALAIERSIMGNEERRRTATARDGARPSGPGSHRIAERLIEMARQLDRADPLIRDAIARVYSMQAVHQWTGMRASAETVDGGSLLMSLGKLAMSRLRHYSATVQTRLVGADAMLDGDSSELGAESTFLSLNAYYTSIGGGTDQIQRNVLGERVLGLPKEVDPSRDVPFRDFCRVDAIERRAPELDRGS